MNTFAISNVNDKTLHFLIEKCLFQKGFEEIVVCGGVFIESTKKTLSNIKKVNLLRRDGRSVVTLLSPFELVIFLIMRNITELNLGLNNESYNNTTIFKELDAIKSFLDTVDEVDSEEFGEEDMKHDLNDEILHDIITGKEVTSKYGIWYAQRLKKELEETILLFEDCLDEFYSLFDFERDPDVSIDILYSSLSPCLEVINVLKKLKVPKTLKKQVIDFFFDVKETDSLAFGEKFNLRMNKYLHIFMNYFENSKVFHIQNKTLFTASTFPSDEEDMNLCFDIVCSHNRHEHEKHVHDKRLTQCIKLTKRNILSELEFAFKIPEKYDHLSYERVVTSDYGGLDIAHIIRFDIPVIFINVENGVALFFQHNELVNHKEDDEIDHAENEVCKIMGITSDDLEYESKIYLQQRIVKDSDGNLWINSLETDNLIIWSATINGEFISSRKSKTAGFPDSTPVSRKDLKLLFNTEKL